MSKIMFSYVVRYDSGFAPNPFFGYCTLATCKPKIRKDARYNDWVVGTGSGARDIKRAGHLVYAMRVTEVLPTTCYWHDKRFEKKKPDLFLSWKSASGDNIYEPVKLSQWKQLDSYHSHRDGSRNNDHVERDTNVEKILVSEDFVYFGGEGPKLPDRFINKKFDNRRTILCEGRADRRIRDSEVIADFENWFRSLGVTGVQGKPHDWIRRRK